ncbi:hypothetical protein BUN20_21825 [Bacteroides fragilis]|uniref:hypothetical protein n=1 Tax=Bacteroides fragilis TaxID=817 RepID=UPI000C75C885|nr:hypothetical protein [Bacteroides fragilis]AUI48921.1 hypothetical protein BUN20_21825 [Bacteroides fragilis]
METKTVFGTETYQAEILLSEKTNDEGKKAEGISLQLFQGGKIKLENGQLVSIELSKEDAKELAIQLLKVSSEPVPQRGGLSIDNYGEWGFTLYHATEEGGKLCDEPLVCIDGVQTDDIPEDGSISICLTNKSARDMISGLATIV